MVDQVKSITNGQDEMSDKEYTYIDIHPELKAYIDSFEKILSLKSFKRGYIISGIDFRYFWVSKNIVDYIGLSREKLLGKLPEDFSVSVKNKEIIKQLQEAIDGKEPEEIEFEVKLNENGKVMTLKKIVEALKCTNGKLIGILSTFEDVTQKKIEAQKEKEQRLFFKEAEESAGAGAYREFLDAGIWIGSDNLCKILGIQGGEIKRNNEEFFAYVHPDDKSMLIDYYKKIISGEIPEFDKEYRMIRPDNQELIWVHGKGKVKKDDISGKMTLSGIIIDITEKKRNQEELRKVTNLLLAITSGSKDFISTIGLDGKFTFVNPSLADFLGQDVDNIKGKTMCEILGIDSTPLRETIEEIIKTKSHVLKEERFINKTGEEKILSTMRGPIFDNEKNVIGIFSICRDITDVKELEKTKKQLQLKERMAELGVLIEGVSHDFNNILTPIMGFVDLVLLTEKGLSGGAKEYLESIKIASIRARDLIIQLKQMTKNTTIEKSDFDIYDVISEVFKLLFSTTNRLIDKQIIVEKGFHNVIGNKGELNQVFMNLGVNSVQAINEKSITNLDFIRVKSENIVISKENNLGLTEGNYVHIIFEDSGIGMSQEVLEKAYTPFYTTKTGNGGTGIGLATVYNIIVNNHNGAINIESTQKVGTKVHIYLPLSDKINDINNEKKVEVLGGNETILIIEDETAICKMLKVTLEQLGYEVIVAKNGKEGLNIIQSNPNIDLISLDLNMPEMSGEQLLDALPQEHKAKIIVSSGYSQNINPELLNKIGGMINKPFEIKKFTGIIRELLDSNN